MMLLKRIINKENSLQLSLLVLVPYLLINTGILTLFVEKHPLARKRPATLHP